MIYLTYPTALEFWLDGTGRGDVITPYKTLDFSPENVETGWSGGLNLSMPVSVMVDDAARRRSNPYFRCAVKPSVFPANAFVQISEKVCVESPEMSFLEAARHLNLTHLVELGNCLCGSYVFDSNAKYYQRRRIPVTNAKKIAEFLDNAGGANGVKLARRAIRYVMDGSGSPMESKIGTIWFLPPGCGGYGLKVGIMNGTVALSAPAGELLNGAECHADITWEEDLVAFEYDSELTHANDAQRRYDARRRMAMEESGYRVITFTNDTVSSFSDFEKSTLVLRDCLSMKKRPTELAKHRERRKKIFVDLFKTRYSFF